MSDHRSTRPPLRRAGVVTTIGSVLGAGAFVLLGIGGAANASGSAIQAPTHVAQPNGDDYEPQPPDNLDDFLEDDPDDPIPTPDGPIYQGPILTIPVVPDDDDGPIYEGPMLTIPFPPGDTTTVPADPPADPPETTEAPPVETSEAPESPGTTLGPGTTVVAVPSDQGDVPTDVPPFLRITSATVNCAGMVHLTYETGGSPAPAESTEHVVMFSAVSNPTAVVAQRLTPRPVEGLFTVDLQAPVAEGYRVSVVADFEPTNTEGVLLIDEADAAAPVDCPVAESSG